MFKITEEENYWRSVLGFGQPKCGKTSFSLTAPQPILVLNFDGGVPGLPPGVSGSEIYIQNYPPADVNPDLKKSGWARSTTLGECMMQDILDVRNQLMKEGSSLELNDWFKKEKVTIPRPQTVVLDGLVEFNQALLDWLMGRENMKDPSDAEGDALKFWGKRLDRFNNLLRFLLPTPVHKVLNTWDTAEMVKERGAKMAEPTGVRTPDIGGKLDAWAAGKVDASLYFYTEKRADGVHHFVCTKPNAKVKCVGVRSRFDLPEQVDITINLKEVGTAAYLSPWERVWGKAVAK